MSLCVPKTLICFCVVQKDVDMSQQFTCANFMITQNHLINALHRHLSNFVREVTQSKINLPCVVIISGVQINPTQHVLHQNHSGKVCIQISLRKQEVYHLPWCAGQSLCTTTRCSENIVQSLFYMFCCSFQYQILNEQCTLEIVHGVPSVCGSYHDTYLLQGVH